MTVVFYCPTILRNYHKDLYDLERLKSEGYDVILLDASKYHGLNNNVTDEFILDHKVECRSKEDFFSFRQSLPQEPVLFVSFDLYMKSAVPVFDIIIRKKDILLSHLTKRFSSIDKKPNLLDRFSEKAIPFLDKFLPLHFFKTYYEWRYNIFIPDYYLSSTRYLIPSKIYLTVKKSHRIVVHADDINHIIKHRKSLPEKKKKIGVFLDQGIPFLNKTHPVIYHKPIPESYLHDYYRKLEENLLTIKNHLALDEVVIALHPTAKAFSKELSEKFIGFRTLEGATNHLVKDSHVVFGHCSTALSFAVYYKKPVVIFKDQFLMNYHDRLANAINFFIDEVGMTAVDMDKQTEAKKLSAVKIDYKKYEHYTHRFLKDNDIQENSYYYAIERIREDLNY